MALAHPFEPIIDKDSRVLILGTFPSKKSFENSFYYSHPRNQFWRLVAGVFEEDTPQTIEEKRDFLHRHHIALWDVVRACERSNSLDSSLKNIQPNDIEALVQKYPAIKAIMFTGKKAQNLYNRYFAHLSYPTHYLPSPSPAFCAVTFEEKLQNYRMIKNYVCDAT